MKLIPLVDREELLEIQKCESQRTINKRNRKNISEKRIKTWGNGKVGMLHPSKVEG